MDVFTWLSPASSLASFSPDSLPWLECARLELDAMHPRGKACPHCHIEIEGERHMERWYQCEDIKCRNCGRGFSSLTGTYLHKAKLDLREIHFLKIMTALHAPLAVIADRMQVSERTVRNWQSRFAALAEVAGA